VDFGKKKKKKEVKNKNMFIKTKSQKEISRKDFILSLIESKTKLTITDLAIRTYGEDTFISRQQVGQVLTSLRGDGIWAYPRKKHGAVIIPRVMAEYRDIIKHVFDEGGISKRVFRALSLLVEGIQKYPVIIEENKSRIVEIERPIRVVKKEIKKIGYQNEQYNRL